jgi:hypothetical protein
MGSKTEYFHPIFLRKLLRSFLPPLFTSSQRIRSRADCKSGLVISQNTLHTIYLFALFEYGDTAFMDLCSSASNVASSLGGLTLRWPILAWLSILRIVVLSSQSLIQKICLDSQNHHTYVAT